MKPQRIAVLGSSSLLASKPDLGEPGHPLELSFDADLLIDPCDEKQAAVIHEAIGEGSLFHKEYGVYADLMKPDIVETLPQGWQTRCLSLKDHETVQCLNPYDLAIVKLGLGRDKDRVLLKALLQEGILDLTMLREAYQKANMNEAALFKAGRTLHWLESECGK